MEYLFWLINLIVYFVLAMIALWGAFCVILAWRRVALTRFRSEKQQMEFLRQLEQMVRAGNLDDASAMCQSDRRAMPQLALFALINRNLGYNTVRQRVVERFQHDVLADLEHRLSWVNTVVRSAPMVGLLGTVIGMMGAFANLSSGEQVDPTGMAEDIYFALITTACGLAIAIPLVMSTASIHVRIRKMEDLMASGLNQLFDILGGVLARRPKGE